MCCNIFKVPHPQPMNMKSSMRPVKATDTIITGKLKAIHVAKFTDVGSVKEL